MGQAWGAGALFALASAAGGLDAAIASAAAPARDVEVHWSPDVPIYSTAAVGCEDSHGLVIDGLSESGSPPKGNALQLKGTEVARIERTHLRAPGG